MPAELPGNNHKTFLMRDWDYNSIPSSVCYSTIKSLSTSGNISLTFRAKTVILQCSLDALFHYLLCIYGVGCPNRAILRGRGTLQHASKDCQRLVVLLHKQVWHF